MTPGELFIELWQSVEGHAGEIISVPWHGRVSAEFAHLVSTLVDCRTESVPVEFHDYLAGKPVAFPCDVAVQAEREFVVMCALDEAAGHIHPSTKSRVSGLASTTSEMLVAMRERRVVEGAYAESNLGYIIPKGKLITPRRENDDLDASGTEIAHQFTYLTLARRLARGRELKFLTFSPSRFQSSETLANKVGFAPIAEDAKDLVFNTSSRLNRPYLDTCPVGPVLSDRINETVLTLIDRGAGVVVLPELVSGATAVQSLSRTLKRDSKRADVLILSGTGPGDRPSPAGPSYNEAVVLDGKGDILFCQRKLNLFNMGFGRMKGCDIPFAAGFSNRNHMEDAMAGNEIVVCDLFGLGRVVVLICEDLQQTHPGELVCLDVRPDWVLTPVLDVGPAFGRWVHSRALEIGGKTQSRFVVSGSGTLVTRDSKQTCLSAVPATKANIGMCVDGEFDFHAHLVSSDGVPSPVCAIVDWNPSSWPRHVTTAGGVASPVTKATVKRAKPARKRVTSTTKTATAKLAPKAPKA
jgi:hypothetical protein